MCSEINLRICTNVLVSVHLYSSKNVYVSIVLVRHNWNIFHDILPVSLNIIVHACCALSLYILLARNAHCK
jgi:hypothetical protein